MSGATVHVTRSRVLDAPLERVRFWLTDPRELNAFGLNLFHARVASDAGALVEGARVAILHRLGLATERRIARVTRATPNELAWSEVKESGDDWFPHRQRLVLEPLGEARCVLRNTLDGAFHLPGARVWLLPWYRPLLPKLLDLENRRVARAVEG